MTVWSTIGHFSHGLVFFSLSLIATFLRYRSQRVVLTRQLGWLTAFALGEALLAWVPLLIPMLSEADLAITLSRAILMAISYAFLFGFGLQNVLESWNRRVNVIRLMSTVQAVWIVLFAFTFIAQAPAWGLLLRTAKCLCAWDWVFPEVF